MGSIAIFGTTYNDLTAAFAGGVGTPIVGTYYALDPLGAEPSFSPIIEDRREISFPGLDWTAEKTYGKRKQLLYIDLIIFATLTNLRANMSSLFTALATNTRGTIAINGTSFDGCKLDIPATARGQRVWNGGGICGERVSFVFKRLSDSN